jgi:hypothetical protein
MTGRVIDPGLDHSHLGKRGGDLGKADGAIFGEGRVGYRCDLRSDCSQSAGPSEAISARIDTANSADFPF